MCSPRVVHTLPVLIRADSMDRDLEMFQQCIESLVDSDIMVVAYNQGCLLDAEIRAAFAESGVPVVVLGNGNNDGIPLSRQACFQYTWDTWPKTPYVSEIHLDMVFTKGWLWPLVQFLEDTDEPMVCPSIVTAQGDVIPERTTGRKHIDVSRGNVATILTALAEPGVSEGFVHPVLHRVQALRAVGGYDLRFLRGKQGFEDDSLLLSYLYYMGTRTNWKPKCLHSSVVFHAVMAQRMQLPGANTDFQTNLNGLLRLYGASGFWHLSKLRPPGNHFESLFEQIIRPSMGQSDEAGKGIK